VALEEVVLMEDRLMVSALPLCEMNDLGNLYEIRHGGVSWFGKFDIY